MYSVQLILCSGFFRYYLPFALPTELNRNMSKKAHQVLSCFLCRRLSIFPSRYQLSIFDASELNYCVRNGNRWTLTAINTDYVERELSKLNNEIRFDINLNLGLSPRPISTRKLNASLHLHIEPINLVVFKGS